MILTSPKSPAALWAAYTDSRSDEDRNALVDHYSPLAIHAATSFYQRLPNVVQLEELIQYASEGLMRAVELYDPNRGFKFSTFACRRIKGAMIDALREMMPVSRVRAKRIKTLNEAEATFAAEHGRPPSEEELTALCEPEVLAMAADRERCTQSLTPDHQTDDNDDVAPLLDQVQDHRTADPADLAEAREQVQYLMRYAANNLRLSEAVTLRCYYFEHMTMKQIGEDVLRMTESGVCMVHRNALKRLRAVA